LIHLFTIACTDASTPGWWSRALDSERSYCFDRLTNLIEPDSNHDARFAWLDTLAAGEDDDTAARFDILRGWPEYFARLWEQSRVGPYHVGNADDEIGRLLHGLWLLWPDMKFLFASTDGIVSVEAARPSSDEQFEQACRQWAALVTQHRAAQRWLRDRGADIHHVALDRATRDTNELREPWQWLTGDWAESSDSATAALADLAAARGTADEIWGRWPSSRRTLFAALCGEAQRVAGYTNPGGGRRRLFGR
jgi:hypothetical protein